MRNTALAVIAMVVLAAAPSWAQTGAGTMELGMSASSQKFENDDTGDKVTTTIISVLYGYFVTDAIELAGSLSVIENDMGPAQVTQTGLELQFKYHFTGLGELLMPYIGAQAGVYGFDDGTTDLFGNSYGLMGGAKYFVSQKTSVNLEYNYRTMALKDDDDNEYDATVTVLGIGYSIYF